MVKTFMDIEELMGNVIQLERLLEELGETPYEPLKEEQEKKVSKTMMEKQVIVLNNTFINFFRNNVPNQGTIFLHNVKRMLNLQRRKPFSHHLSEIK